MEKGDGFRDVEYVPEQDIPFDLDREMIPTKGCALIMITGFLGVVTLIIIGIVQLIKFL